MGRFLLFFPLIACAAVGGRGGLEAVAVSRDGTLLAVGGQNRVIYILDAGTLEVKRRLPVRVRVGALAFAPDGKSVLVEDETDTLRRLDAETGKELGKMPDASGLRISPSGEVVAVRDLSRPDRPALRLLSAATLEVVGRCILEEKASAFAFAADGKRLVVLEMSAEAGEKRLPLANTPADLKGLARIEWQQKHDGRTAWVRTFAVPSGKELSSVRTWFVSDSDTTVIHPAADDVVAVNRANACARIKARGETVLFRVGERGPMSAAFSVDGKSLWVGGRGGGTSGGIDNREPFELDELPGQAEFVTGLCVRNGGAFGVTTGFRVFRVEKGTVKAAAVY